MPSVVVLNPAAVDGYGNPISVTRDEDISANRILADAKISNQPGVKILDSNGNELKTVNEGGQTIVLAVRDEAQECVLREILVQMKKINFYLAQMADQDIEDNDVD